MMHCVPEGCMIATTDVSQSDRHRYSVSYHSCMVQMCEPGGLRVSGSSALLGDHRMADMEGVASARRHQRGISANPGVTGPDANAANARTLSDHLEPNLISCMT
jgi:hypothetical protein